MTVGELLEKLQDVDPETEVVTGAPSLSEHMTGIEWLEVGETTVGEEVAVLVYTKRTTCVELRF